MLNGRNRLPQELVRLLTYLANSQPRNGCAIRVRSLTPRAGTIIYYAQQAALSTKTTRSPTPRAVRPTTSPREGHKHSNKSVAYNKSGTIDYFALRAAQSLQQLGRLHQERYDRLLRPRSGTTTPTTRSPTPRAVRSTTSPKERHKLSNNLVTYPKSGMIDYFAKGVAQAPQQLGRLPQERYDRLPRPISRHLQIYNSVAYTKSGTIDNFAQQAAQSTKKTRSPTPRAVQSTTSPQE